MPASADVAKDADALLILTEWNEFKQLSWPKLARFMRHPIVLDGRNLYEPADVMSHGFTYWGVGRSIPPVAEESVLSPVNA